MIRSPKNPQNLVINVFLKNGDEFLEKDIPPVTFGEKENFVSFWVDEAVLIYPMDAVARVELYEKA